MPALHLCPECQAELPGDAPEGLCPKCLLQSGFDSDGHEAFQEGNGTSVYQSIFVPPSPAELAIRFPQLEIVELLGQGGMGAVYKARQKKLDRLVALKILPPLTGREPAFAERFTREAKALARLSHPNIVAVHDFGEVEGLFYFIMEYVDGPNLRQVLQVGPLEPEEALNVVPQVCDALQYAHEEEIVHRDIKPENILLDKRGRVKIADFGLAKLLGRTTTMLSLTNSHQVMGTPYYMAPEQMHRTHDVDHRADIYSLGVVLYEMLTGDLPMGRFALPSQKANVDARLDDVILRALEKEPDQRYQRISEVKSDVQAIVGGGQVVGIAPHVRHVELESVQQRLSVYSTLLSVLGVFVILAAGIFMAVIPSLPELGGSRFHADFPKPLYYVLSYSGAVLVVLYGLFLIVGAVCMKHLHSYGTAMTACILLLPSMYLLPLGIWGIVLLSRKEVKAAFQAKRAGLSHVTLPAPKAGPVKQVVSFARNMGEFMFHSMPRNRDATPPPRTWKLPRIKLPEIKPSAIRLPQAFSPSPVATPVDPAAKIEVSALPSQPNVSEQQPGNAPAEALLAWSWSDLAVAAAFLGGLIISAIVSEGMRAQGYLYAAVLVAYLMTYYSWKSQTVKIIAGAMVAMTVLLCYFSMHKLDDPLGFGIFAWIGLLYFGYSFLSSFHKEEEANAAENNWGLPKHDADLLRTLRRFNVTPLSEIEPDTLMAVRQKCSVPAEDRVLALVWLADENDQGENCLAFGTQAIYYHQGTGMPRSGTFSLAYGDFEGRTFVNHGKAIYLGKDQYIHVDPDSFDCEELASILNAVLQSLRARYA